MSQGTTPTAPAQQAELVASKSEHHFTPVADYNDVGNAERMKAYFGKLIRHAFDADRTFIFDEKRGYIPAEPMMMEMAKQTAKLIPSEIPQDWYDAAANGDKETVKVAKAKIAKHLDWAVRSGFVRAQQGMIKNFLSDQDIVCMMDDFDSNAELLACNNGVLNLRTREFTSHRPEYMTTQRSRWNYDPQAKPSEDFLTIIKTLSGGDKEYERALGTRLFYMLTAYTHEKDSLVIYFPERNVGKSSLAEILAHGLGDYACSTDARILTDAGRQSADHHTASLMPVVWRRMAWIDEMSSTMVLDTAKMKKFTSGAGQIPIRGVGSSQVVHATPRFKLFITTNSLPRLPRSDGPAFHRFSILGVQGMQFYKFDPMLKRRILDSPEAMSGVLNWVLQWGEDYFTNGLASCQAIEDNRASYQEEMDPLHNFLEEWVERVDTSETKLQLLYDHYRICCERTGDKKFQYTMRGFAKALRERGLTVQKSNSAVRVKGLAIVPLEDIQGEEKPKAQPARPGIFPLSSQVRVVGGR